MHATGKNQLSQPTHILFSTYRRPEDQDLMNLHYGSTVVLRVDETCLFAGIEFPAGVVSSSIESAFPFTIINAKHPRDKGPVRFQHTVCLVHEDLYLTAENNGAVTGKVATTDSRAKWTLVSAYDYGEGDCATAESTVKIFDKVALRSCFAYYLTYGEDGQLNANGRVISKQQTWNLRRSNLPFVPAWDRSRPLELHGVSAVPSGTDKQAEKLMETFNSYPSAVQEQLLLEDLLSVMMGIEGKYIVVSVVENGVPTFSIHPSIQELTLSNVLQRILPICSFYAHAHNYVLTHSRHEYGLVNHALCAAVKELLKEYLVMIAQLERQFLLSTLTLLRAWFYIQPSLRMMECLSKLLQRGQGIQGGALLNIIYKSRQAEGEGHSRALHQFLLAKAAVPYLEMLGSWIYQGVVTDPYQEFQIHRRTDLSKENLKSNFNDRYWDELFTVNQDKLPLFLAPLSEQVLQTGKYLNVIRECGRAVNNPGKRPLIFSENTREYTDAIDDAYHFASRELLMMLMVEHELIGRLESIRRYFLLSQGDFFTHFMDIAGEELDKPVVHTISPKLESLLSLAVRTSNAQYDPFKDDLSCYLQQYSLAQVCFLTRHFFPLLYAYRYTTYTLTLSQPPKQAHTH